MEINGAAMPQNPTIIIELVPGTLAGQPDNVEIRHENCPGWPMAVQLIAQALNASLPKAYQQLAQEKPKLQIVPSSQLPPSGD